MTDRKRVYIIEDNPEAGMIASALIESAGLAETTVIADGLEGLAACIKAPPDALVLDLELPSLRGEEILRLLRTSREHRNLPIVISSALPAAKRHEMKLLQVEADAYLDKPLMESTFLNVMAKLLGKGNSRNAAEMETAEGSTPTSRHFIAEALAKELREGRPAGDNTQTPVVSREETVTAPLSGPAPTPPSQARPVVADKKDNETYEGYRILGVVGAGGMGTVYRAEQVKLHRIVALKVLLEDYHENREMRERFHREALIMAQVNHPNIVQVFEAGKTDFSSFFAMEFVDGASLEASIRESAINWEECPSIVRQTCNAVAHLHSTGIIHRDIKPSNILVSKQGLVKVTDFGISQARFSFETRDVAGALQIVGTPDYMAPELMRFSEAGEKTDQYALGMTFWRMFAGQDAQPLGRPLGELHPEIPEALSNAVARCISPRPADRFDNVLQARDALLDACKGTFSGTWEEYNTPQIFK